MCLKRASCLILPLLLLVCIVNSGKVRHRSPGKQGLKYLKNQGIGGFVRRNASDIDAGLWPSVFNLATKAIITANATCGEGGREEFCRISEGNRGKCGVCDNFSESGKKHPIHYAIEGTSKWWQSPALFYGKEYEYVTIIIDLKQVYQIAYILMKAANSPRPGTWILERSLDGNTYHIWQYFARSDRECFERFGIPPTKRKPKYYTDSEVICTSYYSQLAPFENGEIHVSLISGRPGANETSPELLEFTKARFVRMRFMGLRGNVEPFPKWLSQDLLREKRLFYSIRDITIGGQCVCNGHAESCRHNVGSGHPECECAHHTCGPNCEKCCPLYNQRQWGAGSSRDAKKCLPCNCHGHATSCHYNEDVDRSGQSMDIHGNYQGGGVCDNCTAYTAGINCEKCVEGYYRPEGVLPDADIPCVRCDCDPAGSSGRCIQTGAKAGTCDCLPEYAGERCDECAPGYRGFPRCEICPCDTKGVMEIADCEGECICKENVGGKYCDQCKPGYFGLRGDYQEGCASCYCSEVTTLCESAAIKSKTINVPNEWLITDLRVSKVVVPSKDDSEMYSIGNYELPGTESLYWLAPEEYIGNKLESYSSYFTFKVHWIIMRGDTSGEPTTGPNIIIIGRNGMKIAHGNDCFTISNMTFRIQLNEVGWFHIPQDVRDIVTRPKRTEFKRSLVDRKQFLSVLQDIQHILLRATYHTDQIEGLLEEAVLEIVGVDDSEEYSAVEQCSCPSGYSGLSCESCSFGYVRISVNGTNEQEQRFCVKCDCNGHSETCIPTTGECFCQHNTIGKRCERCAPGFYGNPLHGTPGDCKICACPLENEENNFSPSCQLDYYAEREEDEGGYVCTQCPEGYTGDHCEICDSGYFGNPLEYGNSCKPCDCNGGPCDSATGQCLSCKGNTEGFKCERCKPDFYGNAEVADCKPCECDHLGSVSNECDKLTGQCVCKDKFTGRRCDKCEVGYGNVTALCTPCSCHPVGSVSETCDQHSGLCTCYPGVEGFHCDACQNFYYGFSEDGCKECGCNADGSLFQTCDENGYCRCRPNFVGKQCTHCKDGYWKGSLSQGCIPCECNLQGAINNMCDKNTGVCTCQPGIGGYNCNRCADNYYGDLTTGCKACDPCNKRGHICNPTNGKCVCPPLTTGADCQRCVDYAWGYEPGIGCKDCECSLTGSVGLGCNLRGICTCKEGFEGEKCNKCSYGYYGYPNCEKCKCNIAGTINRLAECDSTGRCQCKANVVGQHCDQCSEDAFGLDESNPYGCTKCFCFGRSKQCRTSDLTWYPIRTDKPLEVSIYDCKYQSPCWILPRQFMGDLTTSYGGYFQINSSLKNASYLSVYMKGNDVTLKATLSDNRGMVTFTEDYWEVDYDPNDIFSNCKERNNWRQCYMVVLQDVSDIVIENIVGKSNFNSIKIQEVFLYNATNFFGGSPALTVEKCTCPKEYTSFSCQDPNNGYYRYFPPPEEQTSWVDGVIGVAKPCQCNGHSKECDKETGHCMNCSNNTGGAHCESCTDGYYEDGGMCLPCKCPSAERNFATKCIPVKNEFVCQCKKGYIGKKCEICDQGYFGDPLNANESCEECSCHPTGRIDNMCDKITGTCRCKEGFTGDKCDQCSKSMTVIENGVCTPCDECSQLLFKQIEELSNGINSTLAEFKNGIGPPWQKLNNNIENYLELSHVFNNKMGKYNDSLFTTDMDSYETIANKLKVAVNKRKNKIENAQSDAKRISTNSKKLFHHIEKTDDELNNILNDLENFGTSQININTALSEAKRIHKEMKDTAKKFKKFDKYKEIFHHCNMISSNVSKVYNITMDPSVLKTNLTECRQKLGDTNALLDKIEHSNKLTKHKNNKLKEHIKLLKEKIDEINNKNQITLEEFQHIINTTDGTRNVLEKITTISQILMKKDFDKIYNELENSTETISRSLIENEAYRNDVQKHVKDLEEFLRKINSSLNFTKEEWDKIEASESYENIYTRIQQAKKSVSEAKDILKKALISIEPELKDSLADNASIALAFSDRLKRRIQNLEKSATEFHKVASDIEMVKYSIHENGKLNNDVTKMLRNMEEEMAQLSEKDMMKIQKSASEIINRMTNIDAEIKNINYTSHHTLFKNFNNYLNLTLMGERDTLKINLTKQELDRINLSDINYIWDKNQGLNITNPNIKRIQNQLKELKNKIEYARQLADAIDLPLKISNCSRTFRFQRKEILRSLSIKFVCTTSCVLFNYTDINGEFMSLSVKRKEDESIVILKLESKEEQSVIPNEKIKYPVVVDITRHSNFLTFKVNSTKEATIKTGSTFFIGSELIVGSSKIDNSSIQKLSINGKPFGLWNFYETSGNCTGTFYIDVRNEEAGDLFFEGSGYRFVNVTGYIDRNGELSVRQYTFKAKFGTFDEDALMLLAQNIKEPCSYFALYLNNGKIELKVHNPKDSTVLASEVKCNDGSRENEVLVAKDRNKFYLNINCGGSTKSLETEPKFSFSTAKANYYIGGVPPVFDDNVKCVDVNLKSYLGYFQPTANVYNDLSLSTSYGVSHSKEELNFNEALFKRHSYLHVTLPEKLNSDKFKINFIILPNSPNGHVMQIGNLGIFLSNYNVIIENSSQQVHKTSVKQSQYNYITFSVEYNKQNGDTNEYIGLSDEDDIYFGKEQPNEEEDSFVGEISSIEINDRPVVFNKTSVKRFFNVEIGRHGKVIVPTLNDSFKKGLGLDTDASNIKDMQSTEGCSSISNFETDPGAIKFGDKPESYIFIQNQSWKKDYEIEFLFRTYYPNGLLFFTMGNQIQNQHYYLLEIRQGNIHLHISKGKKKKLLSFTEPVNDGMWHHLKVIHNGIKKKRKLILSLDGNKKKPMRVPKINVRGELYIGGTRTDFVTNPRSSLIPFRGCMKEILINKTPQVLVKNKYTSYNNIGQCFPNIEKGAYFGGDAYAVYRSDFHVNKILELSFEFRTTEQNGILLSVSNPSNSPALSVELQNGAVAMTIDMGNGVVSNVTKKLESEYALCNNRWHNVTALYSSMELTVNVDGVRRSWVVSELNSLMHEIEAPLYIGGIPDNAATGTLKIRENFKGCIRKLVIENQLMDWTDMEKLNNVLLNSCPVSS